MGDPLEALGWNDRWRALFDAHGAPGDAPGRVVRADRGSVLVATREGLVRAAPAALLRKAARDAEDLPAVGDWVCCTQDPSADQQAIGALLPRTGAVRRAAPESGTGVQVLAANVDLVLVVHPIAQEPNVRRVERELSLAWDSGGVPLIVLTKADLSADPPAAQAAVEAVAPGVDVLALNARTAEGVQVLRERLAEGRTAVLLGPSGAGKSTLANGLLGTERQATGAVRESDQRGRHTTVVRELVVLPGGGVIIDSPGLRSLGLTGSEEGIEATFSDIEALAAGCRFRDCRHEDEPGCAVLAAVEAGELDAGRLASLRKLQEEIGAAAARSDARLRAEQSRRGKVLGRAIKAYYRHHPR